MGRSKTFIELDEELQEELRNYWRVMKQKSRSKKRG